MENLTFEEAFAKLEATVSALQDGHLPLDRALHYYEEGMKLAQHCNNLLQQAELSVQQLSLDSSGLLTIQPLDL